MLVVLDSYVLFLFSSYLFFLIFLFFSFSSLDNEEIYDYSYMIYHISHDNIHDYKHVICAIKGCRI